MPRNIRTAEERIQEINNLIESYQKKIEWCNSKIKSLEDKKERINNPVPRKRRSSMKGLLQKMKESGMTVDEIAKKLDLNL